MSKSLMEKNGQVPEAQKTDELELLEKYLVRTDSSTQT